jgi:hypothetical protein
VELREGPLPIEINRVTKNYLQKLYQVLYSFTKKCNYTSNYHVPNYWQTILVYVC